MMKKIIDTVDHAEAIKRATQSKLYSDTVLDALDSTNSHDLSLSMSVCGDWINGNQHTCHSLYCAKTGRRPHKDPKSKTKIKVSKSCHQRLVDNQTKTMRQVRDRYDDNDILMRQNLRSVTILFSAFGFDIDKNGNPIFPLLHGRESTLSGHVITAKKEATKQLTKIKRKFPNIKWLGAYSWEVQHLDKLGPKKITSAKTLLNLDADKYPTISQNPINWQGRNNCYNKHIILFHCHLVVDLNGTNEDDFNTFAHSIFGLQGNKKRPVPDGVLVKKFNSINYKSVSDSLDTLAQYPFRNQWTYKYNYDGDDSEDGNTDDTSVIQEQLEPELLSALINALTIINKHSKIIINNNWD